MGEWHSVSLEDLGWDGFFEKRFTPFLKKGWVPYRVARVDRNGWLLWGESDPIVGKLSGKLRYHTADASLMPSLGDWVAVKRSESDQGFIQAVLPRKSIFSRKVAGVVLREQVIATNIDYTWVVVACDQSFRFRSIERYITQCHRSGAKPVLVMNKADLVEDLEHWLAQRSITDSSIPVHMVSARSKKGLDTLSPYLRKGVTSALVGSSGVGKSSLVNAIIAQDCMKTGEVRAYDHKGKHTTTKREMIVLPEGGVIIDNPGMREIQLWTDEANLDQSFSDIDMYAKLCKYTNCTHRSEPECAVREALEKGKASLSRWENYQKILRKVRFLEQRKKGRKK